VLNNQSQAKRKLLEKQLRGDRGGTCKSRVAIPLRNPAEPAPLSFAQQQIWAHAQLKPEIPIYNEPITIGRAGPLNAFALEQSLLEIVRRHEILRTTFEVIDEQPVQIVHTPPDRFNLPVVDLRGIPEAHRGAEALRIATEDLRRPFDLQRGPLLRATVVRMDDEDSRLFMVLHHLIHDGVAVYKVFLPELAALYSALETGSRCHLPAPRIQYADYAVWHRKLVIGGVFSNQMNYWREQLAGPLPLLQWPKDRTRPSVQTFRGAMRPLVMPKALIESLRSASRTEGVTLFMMLLAGFLVVLHRYTGQDDILIGTVTTGRKSEEVHDLLGYFLNPLPLRTNLAGDPSFRELLRRVRNVVVGALSHDDVPFEFLVKELEKARDASRSPLFQIMFSLEPSMSPQSSGWQLTQTDIASGSSKLDLFLDMDDRPEGVVGPITYNPDLFEEATIARMVAHWQKVLEAAAADPLAKISELPLLADEERQQLLVNWNATRAPYPQACVHELFEAQVQKTPDALALVGIGAELTYRQLNQRANQLAHYLRKVGAGDGHCVAMCMQRSLDMVVGLLGTLKAGAAYLPIDPSYPQDRVAFMLKDTNPMAVLTDTRQVAMLPPGTAKVVCLDRDWSEISKERLENPSCNLTPDDLAYLIYTSGSTGKPKGVLGTHRGLVNRFHWMWQTYPFEGDDVCCQKTSLSFVDSIWEIFGPLLQGVKTVIVPDAVLKDPPRFVSFVAAHRVTRIVLVPSLLRAILDTSTALAQKLPRLKYWSTSGEALTVEVARRFVACMPRAVLLNLYGSSEAAADSTCWHLEDPEALNCVPIGRPIANTKVYILDGTLQPVPVGVVGELYIGGDGLARGYWNQPEMTAEKFIRNPFDNAPNSRLYKTGDLARYLPDGNIEYSGRADHQVKIRGFRVELKEIESVLAECANVNQGIVVAQDDRAGSNQLVAYVVPVETPKPNQRELRAQLKRILPEYMVPSAIVFLKSFPLLPNGKIDRKALPEPELADRAVESERVAPRNDLERQLLAMWEEVLGVERIGVRHNFFQLGGHSLLIPILLSRIERTLGKKLSPASIFQAPTIEQLAVRLTQHDRQLVQVMPIQPRGSRPPFFCICVAPGPLLRDLAMKMGDDQPFLGLGFDLAALGQLETPYTLEVIASYLVRAIREHQPEGPYFVGGFCLNGLIAFEAARQLTAQGQRMASLALFEAVNPAHGDRFSQWSQLKTLAGRFRLGLIRNHLTSLYGLRTRGARTYFHSRLRDIQRDVRNLLWSSYVECRLKIGGNRLPNLQQILYVAARNYRPKPYTGNAVFFRCTERRAIPTSELERGWHGVLVHCQLHVLEGDHLGILSGPSLQVLADRLKASLSGTVQSNQQQRQMAQTVAPNSKPMDAKSFPVVYTQGG